MSFELWDRAEGVIRGLPILDAPTLETVTISLKENTTEIIAVLCVPWHMGIEGSDRVDEIAKGPTELEPTTESTIMAKATT